MTRKFVVRLTGEERDQLAGLVTKGKAAAYKIKHANVLLKADADGPSWTDKAIAKAYCCSVKTVALIRQRFVERGLSGALERKRQSRLSRLPILDGEKEARLIALSCSKPPTGRAAWTLRLLSERLVALEIVESISYETVRVALKKTSSSRICASAG